MERPDPTTFNTVAEYPNAFTGLPHNPALDHLKDIAHWVCWIYKAVQQPVLKGEAPLPARRTKPPINPKTGEMASVADPSTWATYEEAKGHAVAHNLPGVGFVLTDADNLIGFDLDDCLDANGNPEPWVQSLLDLKETYAEISPSGRGIRMLARGKLANAVKSAEAGVEMYGTGRYLTITGNQLFGSTGEICHAPQTQALLLAHVESKSGSARQSALAGRAKPKPPSGTDFYRNVNEAALHNLKLWVPELLPEAVFISDEQGYRVTSESLGRDLEEDLCIHPTGIVDFGVADQGDGRDGKRTAIDLVIEYAANAGLEVKPLDAASDEKQGSVVNAQNALLAAHWLCEQIALSPWQLGARPKTESDWVSFLNETYCVVNDGGRTSVISFKKNKVFATERQEIEYWSFHSFKEFYMNQYVTFEKVKSESRGGRQKESVVEEQVKVGDLWLSSPNRRQYTGITFQPNKGAVVNGELNLWQGFAVTPKRGDWSLMQQHIFEVLADGDDASALYIKRWCAFALQYPNKRAEVAIVFKGKQGTGKGALCNTIHDMFGQHAIEIASVDQLLGRFNAHFRDAVLMVADEAVWPGNHSYIGPLKQKITEPTLFIEAKGRNGTVVPNYLHLMMASNETWVVPASENERRYAVFNVSDKYMQQSVYFTQLFNEVINGGREAMMYDLLQLDLTDWHPRDIPLTVGLAEQQEAGLEPKDAWFKEILEAGFIPGALHDDPSTASTASLLHSLQDYSPGPKMTSPHLMGQFLRKQGCTKKKGSDNLHYWTFPSISSLRETWSKRFAGTTWIDADIVEWKVVSPAFGNFGLN